MVDTTTLLIDGHVHVYQHYDLNRVLEGGAENLRRAAAKGGIIHEDDKAIPILLLSERHDCNFFKQAMESSLQKPVDGFTFHRTAERESLLVKKNDQLYMFIIAGRQIVTSEGLEIISVMTTLYIKDRSKSTQDVVRKVSDSGGYPVINWAPGKWFFKRGEVVNNLIDSLDPTTLLIGDTTLRTTLWPLPSLMKKAKQNGFKIIAGSDPLPFKDEEKNIGTYGFVVKAKFDESRPCQSIRAIMRDEKTVPLLIGSRNNLIKFFKRQVKIMVL